MTSVERSWEVCCVVADEKRLRRGRVLRLRLRCWRERERRRRDSLGKACGRSPFGRCEELEKTLALVARKIAGAVLECWTGPVERSAVSPLQLPLLLNSLSSVEEAVRVRPNPGPGALADWTLAARDKHAVGGRRAPPSNHQLQGLAASG
jgi:hypothetical protein